MDTEFKCAMTDAEIGVTHMWVQEHQRSLTATRSEESQGRAFKERMAWPTSVLQPQPLQWLEDINLSLKTTTVRGRWDSSGVKCLLLKPEDWSLTPEPTWRWEKELAPHKAVLWLQVHTHTTQTSSNWNAHSVCCTCYNIPRKWIPGYRSQGPPSSETNYTTLP